MPTYDYKCKKCGHTYEESQSMSSKKLVICPSCGKPGLVRLMSSGTGLVFKGSGFYQTDYKKSSASAGSSSSKPESSSTEKSSDSKTDSKKTETKPKEPPPSKSKPDPK
jgi:putative FmdB family regulatory protein